MSNILFNSNNSHNNNHHLNIHEVRKYNSEFFNNDTKAEHQIEIYLDQEKAEKKIKTNNQNLKPKQIRWGRQGRNSENSIEDPIWEEKSLFQFMSNLCCTVFKFCDCHHSRFGDMLWSLLKSISCFQSPSKNEGFKEGKVNNNSTSTHRVFKEYLHVVLEREAYQHTVEHEKSNHNNFTHRVPLIVEECLNMLEEHASKEGIFRIPGHILEIEQIISAADSNQQLNLKQYSVHTVASVLKRYVRDLPDALIPYDMYREWTALATIPNPHEEKETLLNLFARLPDPNRTLFIRILRLLRKVSQPPCLASSRMNESNLAFIWGMNFLRPSDSEIRTDIGKVSHAIILCIREYEALQQRYDKMNTKN
ncbi:hypothetical protein C9374_000814 [Naegleria lovaniensis]|uniref:Rho-GAP domain-containing protein n=1 Tax=Naegleria lovaniensis TaxID=51637 RepID=A0AA88GYF2_NAELO|nr:uncharacterized protein C9374_000814 [Naegleria lovaniensis]KAG2387964.1 hypothetical protein C9374_000814 [Naegleria lovaniensis]